MVYLTISIQYIEFMVYGLFQYKTTNLIEFKIFFCIYVGISN
jgi:hypothetical protein